MRQNLVDDHKLSYHPHRIAQWMTNPFETFPIYVEISPVGYCNHNCIFCALPFARSQYELNEFSLRRNLLNMSDKGVKSIMFGGEGEPSLWKPLAETIVFAKSACSLDVALTTNGTGSMFNKPELWISSLSWIKFSVDAAESDTYRRIHKAPSQHWPVLQRNIAATVTARDIGGHNTKIGMQLLLLPENLAEAETFIIDAAAIGVDYVVIKPYSQYNQNAKAGELNYEEVERELADMAKNHSSDSFSVIWRGKAAHASQASRREYDKCLATPAFWAYIMATGEVYACSSYLLDDKFKLGSISDNLFSEVWLSDKRKWLIEYVSQKLDVSECRKACRMDRVNCYLHDIKNPSEHKNFI